MLTKKSHNLVISLYMYKIYNHVDIMFGRGRKASSGDANTGNETVRSQDPQICVFDIAFGWKHAMLLGTPPS